MPKYIDLTDKHFGKLTVIAKAASYKCGQSSAATWLCRCECGNTKVIIGQSLRNGTTRSCGCLVGKSNKTHGLTKTPTYRSWYQMKSRCACITHHAYAHYGGRGITVCAQWINSFEDFYKDMGERPSIKHTINRINNDKGYFPDNCEWATKKEQSVNRRSNTVVTYKQETLCATEWSKRLGASRGIVEKRLKAGWSIEKAVTTPSKRYRKK